MYKVITVDDERLIKRSLSALIEQNETGFEIVAEASDGVEAMELIAQHLPHLVITDIRMPRLNGLEFIQKAKEVNQNTKFIILSGYDEFIYAQTALKQGVSDFLLKPIKPNLFLTSLENIHHELDKDVQNNMNRQESFWLLKTYAEDIANLLWMLEEEQVLNRLQEINHTLSQKAIQQSDKSRFYLDLCTYVKKDLANRTENGLDDPVPDFLKHSVVQCDHLVFQYCQTLMHGLKQQRNLGQRTNIRIAVQYIEANFTEPDLSLDEVARTIDMSPSYFSMEFKKEMGISFKQFVTNLKIEKAKKLLHNPIYKTYEIAETIGYADYPHFTKTFKKKTGYSPTDFRKRFGIQ